MDWMGWMDHVSLGDVGWFVANWKGLEFHGRFVYASAFSPKNLIPDLRQQSQLEVSQLCFPQFWDGKRESVKFDRRHFESQTLWNLIVWCWLLDLNDRVPLIYMYHLSDINPRDIHWICMGLPWPKKISDFCDIRRQVKKKGYLTLHIFTSIWPFRGLMKSIWDKFCRLSTIFFRWKLNERGMPPAFVSMSTGQPGESWLHIARMSHEPNRIH